MLYFGNTVWTCYILQKLVFSIIEGIIFASVDSSQVSSESWMSLNGGDTLLIFGGGNEDAGDKYRYNV